MSDRTPDLSHDAYLRIVFTPHNGRGRPHLRRPADHATSFAGGTPTASQAHRRVVTIRIEGAEFPDAVGKAGDTFIVRDLDEGGGNSIELRTDSSVRGRSAGDPGDAPESLPFFAAAYGHGRLARPGQANG